MADESLWSADKIKAAFTATLQAEIDWTAEIIAKPGAISDGSGGDNTFQPGHGIPCEVTEKITDVPGGGELVKFVEQKISEMCNKAAADKRVLEAMNKCLAEMEKTDDMMRSCFHGNEFMGPSGYPTCDSITSYYEDECNDKLQEAVKGAATDAVAAVDGSSVYGAIKSAWDAIPSIPFVFEKPEVEFPTVDANVAEGVASAVMHFMRLYEIRLRAGCAAKMGADCKMVFVDIMPPATAPYALQTGSDEKAGMIPETPEFEVTDKGISLTG